MENNDEDGKPATMLYRGEDGEMREYEIVETHEHESVFQKACPVLPIGIAIICAILNLCPGKNIQVNSSEIGKFYLSIFGLNLMIPFELSSYIFRVGNRTRSNLSDLLQ